MNEEIDFWRGKIDEVDRELVQLLVRRTSYAIEIGRIKAVSFTPVYDPQREQEVMENVLSQAKGEMARDSVRRIFERIIDETRRTEREHSRASAAAGEAGES